MSKYSLSDGEQYNADEDTEQHGFLTNVRIRQKLSISVWVRDHFLSIIVHMILLVLNLLLLFAVTRFSGSKCLQVHVVEPSMSPSKRQQRSYS